MKKEQKEKAKELLDFLKSKTIEDKDGFKIIGDTWIDESIFQIQYQLEGVVDGMYDVVEDNI